MLIESAVSIKRSNLSILVRLLVKATAADCQHSDQQQQQWLQKQARFNWIMGSQALFGREKFSPFLY